MFGPRSAEVPRLPQEPCLRCTRTAPYAGPLDEFGTCPSCASAIREQVTATWPSIVRDCDRLGAFHAWCRAHDDARLVR